MRKLLFLLLLSIPAFAQSPGLKTLSFDNFYNVSITSSKGIVVLNFWATWCKPCVAELPTFEAANAKLGDKGCVILANLDFNSQVDKLVVPFLEKRKFSSRVVHIDSANPDAWINKIDSSWSGAIPATAIYFDGEKKFFHEGEMTATELDQAIQTISHSK
jgi:thiol-disulfide isomerase/thioredoxin